MNKKFLTVALISCLLGFIAKIPYRNFIYNHNIFDFGLSDSLPNFLYIIGIIFIGICFIKNKTDKVIIKLIIFMTLGLLFYEFEQIYSDMVFDLKDVLATVLGSLLSFFLYKHILKKYRYI